MNYRNCYGGKVTDGKNMFKVCGLEININHAILLQLDKMLLLVDNDSVL